MTGRNGLMTQEMVSSGPKQRGNQGPSFLIPMYAEYSQASGVILSKKDKTYIDISLAWEPNPLTGDVTTLRDTRAIDNSLKNIVMTVPLETPFNPDFGSQTYRLLFDPVDPVTANLLESEIKFAIAVNEPRVEVENVYVRPDDVNIQFVVNIEYKIVGTEQLYEVQQILTPTRQSLNNRKVQD